MIITIDGPSGTGKSTVAKAVAKKLNFTFFDTGAMYRSFSWFVKERGVEASDLAGICALLDQFYYEIEMEGSDRRYFVNQVDVTGMIRTQEISNLASHIAVYPEVRQSLVKIQRQFGSSTDAVFEGRDMGTIVFPNAEVKIFLTAKPQVRAERRYLELLQKYPEKKWDFEQVLEETKERDEIDTHRKVSPLRQAENAHLIDTSDLNVDQVVEQVLAQVTKTRS